MVLFCACDLVGFLYEKNAYFLWRIYLRYSLKSKKKKTGKLWKSLEESIGFSYICPYANQDKLTSGYSAKYSEVNVKENINSSILAACNKYKYFWW